MDVKRILASGERTAVCLQLESTPRQRILVVDDESDIRRLNTAVLACSGYEVDAAEDGAAAWEKLRQNRYDLLVTDHNMPMVSGVELLQKLHAAGMEMPVIMATGEAPHDELKGQPWLQIHAILLKPYTFDNLLKTVKSVLHSATRQREGMVPPPNWHVPDAN